MARYSNVRQKSNGIEMSENETKLKRASCNDHFKTGNMKGEKKAHQNTNPNQYFSNSHNKYYDRE